MTLIVTVKPHRDISPQAYACGPPALSRLWATARCGAGGPRSVGLMTEDMTEDALIRVSEVTKRYQSDGRPRWTGSA